MLCHFHNSRFVLGALFDFQLEPLFVSWAGLHVLTLLSTVHPSNPLVVSHAEQPQLLTGHCLIRQRRTKPMTGHCCVLFDRCYNNKSKRPQTLLQQIKDSSTTPVAYKNTNQELPACVDFGWACGLYNSEKHSVVV